MACNSERKYKDLVFHVGFHKTGTTFLQNYIFNQANLIEDERLWKLFWGLNDEGFYTNPFYDNTQSIMEFLDKKIVPGKCNIVSSEGLLGHPASSQVNAKQLLESVMKFSNKIIITIRRQDELILSTYFQYLRNGGSVDFLDFVNQPCAMQKFHFSPYVYDYNDYFDYIELNGGHCLMLPLEYIKDNHYYECLSDFCSFNFKYVGHSAWYGGGEAVYYRFRHIRRFFMRRSWNNYSGVLSCATLPVVDRFANRFLKRLSSKIDKAAFYRSASFYEYYRDRNRILDKKLPFDLKAAGYYK